MVLYASLREQEHDRRAEAFIRAMDPEIWDAYQQDAITIRGACRLVAERIRAALHGLPQPELVRHWQHHQPFHQDSALTTFQNWLDLHRDQDQARAERAAGKQDWEDYRWGVLYEVMHRPMSHCERAEVGTGSRRKWHPQLDAMEDWLEEMWSQRHRLERQAAEQKAWEKVRRLEQLLEVGQEEEHQQEPAPLEEEPALEPTEPQLGRTAQPGGLLTREAPTSRRH